MIKKFLKHLNYYIILAAIFAVGLFLSLVSYPNINLQIIIIFTTIICYVCWGILHHKISHQLTNKILIEYILIGLLGISIVFFIFMGGVGI
jgi:hypothetical protein